MLHRDQLIPTVLHGFESLEDCKLNFLWNKLKIWPFKIGLSLVVHPSTRPNRNAFVCRLRLLNCFRWNHEIGDDKSKAGRTIIHAVVFIWAFYSTSFYSILARLLDVMMLRLLVGVRIEVLSWKWFYVERIYGFFRKIPIRSVVRCSGHLLRRRAGGEKNLWREISTDSNGWAISTLLQ